MWLYHHHVTLFRVAQVEFFSDVVSVSSTAITWLFRTEGVLLSIGASMRSGLAHGPPSC